MKTKQPKFRRILSLVLIVLTLLLASLVTSCNGGTDVPHTKEELAAELKTLLLRELENLKKLSVPRLLASRYEKFRKIGG